MVLALAYKQFLLNSLFRFLLFCGFLHLFHNYSHSASIARLGFVHLCVLLCVFIVVASPLIDDSRPYTLLAFFSPVSLPQLVIAQIIDADCSKDTGACLC